ncbi:MAG: ABC transporter permease, partial [Candidatus Saccharimonadales bacterium]
NTLFIQTKVPPTTKNRAAGANPLAAAISGVKITTLNQRDLDDVRKLNNVTGDYGMVTGSAVASYRGNEKQIIYYGAGSDMFSIDTHTLHEGRFFTRAEDDGAAQVVILGSNLAQDLFGQDEPLGKFMRLGTLNFQVIGVYNPVGGFGGGSEDDSLYMPLGTAQKKMLGINYLLLAVVQVGDVNQVDGTIAQIDATLRDNHKIADPAKDDFTVQSQAQALATFNVIFDGITALLIAIAAISLAVGGVGIMNIMYVVVTERTAEVGLKKALGATHKDILLEFLIESVLVTVLGGIIGIALGALLGWAVALVAQSAGLAWDFSVPLYAVILAVSVSAVIGIGFGVLPALSAARMDPVEAMRYE